MKNKLQNKKAADKEPGMDKEQHISEHIRDLRQVVLSSVIVYIVVFVVIFLAFSNDLLSVIIAPISDRNIQVVFLSLAESLTAKMQLSLAAACIASLPFIIWRVWSFVKPGLYPHEIKMVAPMFALMLFLFAVGVSFAYFVIFSLAVDFLVYNAEDIVTPMLSISQYVGFLFSFVVPFGLVFELPVVTVILVKLNLITWTTMAKARKYVIFAIFVLAAFLTPPDVLSQVLLAIPMVLLYECSIVAAKFVKPR